MLLIALLGHSTATVSGCHQVIFGDKKENRIACQCNATHCDSLQFDWPEDSSIYLRVVSDLAGARFEKSLIKASRQTLSESGQAKCNLPPKAVPAKEQQPAATTTTSRESHLDFLIEVQVNTRRQQVLGFGGAFTDSASQQIFSLPKAVRDRLLDDYFSEDGLDYNVGRLPISGTDMSTRPYSYDDLPEGEEDLSLKHFKLQEEDLLFKIPLIKQVNSMRAKRQLEPLKLIAASWSAPAWMKSNHNLVQGHLLGNSTSGPYYEAYARYQVRFLDEYEHKHGIPIWALSPQNEPLSPKRVGPLRINFNSVNFEPEQMADYLEHCLVPTLLKSNRTSDKLMLFIWDDTLDDVLRYQQAALSSPKVREYTTGLALHWYSQGLREISYKYLYDLRRQLPARYSLISTEACFIGKPRPGEWARGQRYARDLLENLRVGSLGWIDWNLALNMSGGPTWSHNILDAAILVDLERETYYKNPMYYALGQVSRFIKPGSHVLASQVRRPNSKQGDTLDSLADALQQELTVVAAELAEPQLAAADADAEFKMNSSTGAVYLKRQLAVVVLNRGAERKRVQLRLADCLAKQEEPHLELTLPGHSITSLAFVC